MTRPGSSRSPATSRASSRYWLATVVSAEESSTQVEVAFTRALTADGKEHLLEEDLLEEDLPAELASGEIPGDDDRLPVLVALSGNGPQMTSKATAAFMAGARIAQHFGRPSTHNTVRLHEGLGYVTPDDEHHGRGQAIRAARGAGLDAARTARVAARRTLREDHP